MKEVKIPKKGGRFRTIFVPNRTEMKKLKGSLPVLNTWQMALCGNEVHGFMPERNVVTCAEPHVGYMFTLSADLSDFFDTVTQPMILDVNGSVPVLSNMIHNGATRQGLPTSPALANIAAVKLDKKLKDWIGDEKIAYTRYADDLSFSSDDKDLLLKLRNELPVICASCKFAINVKKTRLQYGGRDKKRTREIVGVGVNDVAVVPLRTSKRKLRAAKHKLSLQPNNKRQILVVKGLNEWNKLKKPDTSQGLIAIARGEVVAAMLKRN